MGKLYNCSYLRKSISVFYPTKFFNSSVFVNNISFVNIKVTSNNEVTSR